MKLFYIVLFSTFISYSQPFQKGTLTTQDGESISGYIEKLDKTKTVQRVKYRTEKNGKKSSVLAANVKEIQFKKKKFIIATVQIDNRTSNINKLRTASRMDDFRFQEKTVFLEEIVSGEAVLYRTFLDGTEKFFFKTASLPLGQLLYKKYFLPRGPWYFGSDGAVENTEYHRQLFIHLPCFNKKGTIEYPDFDKPSLKKYFQKFNENNC